jgi:hypothetical protein
MINLNVEQCNSADQENSVNLFMQQLIVKNMLSYQNELGHSWLMREDTHLIGWKGLLAVARVHLFFSLLYTLLLLLSISRPFFHLI